MLESGCAQTYSRSEIVLTVSFIFVLCLGPNSADAKQCTHYVATDGNDSRTRTEAENSNTPWRTIQKAADVAQADDVICVKDGVYTDTDNNDLIVHIKSKSGTANQPITFRSINPKGAKIDGQNFAADYGFYLSDSHHIHIEGFEITGIADTAVNMSGTNSEHHIVDNYIHDIARIKIPSNNGGVCGGNNGIKTGTLTTDVTIERNVFHTIGRLPTTGDGCNYNHDHGVYVYGQRHLIRNNLFYDLKAGWGLQLSPGNADIKIINNTFAFPNPGRGGHIVIWGDKNGILIEDNIFYQPTDGAIRNVGCAGKTNITIRNNLTDLGTMFAGDECDFVTIGNFLGTNPQFMNASRSNPDLHLSDNSPAIDEGLSSSAPEVDFEGTPRPQGNGYDIGADEYDDGLTFSIYGRVEDTEGALLSNVTVSTAGHSAQTDTSGIYTLTGVRNGTYTLSASKSGYQFSPQTVTVADADVHDVDFTGTPVDPGDFLYRYIEAENGTVNSPMRVVNDAGASGGAYIDTPAGTGNTTQPPVEASYTVDITTGGTYYLWARVYGLSPSNDAVYIGFDGGYLDNRIFPQNIGVYEWVRVGNGQTLSGGAHQIDIGHGEEQMRVDLLLVTDDLGFIPDGIQDNRPPGKPNFTVGK